LSDPRSHNGIVADDTNLGNFSSFIMAQAFKSSRPPIRNNIAEERFATVGAH
jgi:hypothetical protein